MTPPEATDFLLTIRHPADDTLEIGLSGALNEGTVAAFREALEQHQAETFARLVFDCQRLSFLSSAGLSALVVVFQRRKRASQTMVLKHVQPMVRKILRLTRLDQHLTIIDSDDPPAA
ncbi:MAG TPA: STAS domain-containing protein [Candidatus Ozemobacteraceae bacterium]|nr:STAS domain-containing protein [Candidatus Ozemobacteraceae bacterium]